MLILFDIDGTLLSSSGAGVAAMGDAGRAMFGDHFDQTAVEYAGRIDPLIILDLLEAHGLPASDDEVRRYRSAYHENLQRRLDVDTTAVSPCPGVFELLDALEDVERVRLGLLTGNFPETGSLKLRAGGIDPERFLISVWGCDSPHEPPSRDHLPDVALSRWRSHFGKDLDPQDAIVVGDTPFDIACARACGCRSLGVATGHFDVWQLEEAGADLAAEDLTATEEIIRWMASQ